MFLCCNFCRNRAISCSLSGFSSHKCCLWGWLYCVAIFSWRIFYIVRLPISQTCVFLSWFEILKIQESLQFGFCPPGDVDETLQVYSVRFWFAIFLMIYRTAGHPQYGQLGHGTNNEVNQLNNEKLRCCLISVKCPEIFWIKLQYNLKEASVKLAYEPQSRPRAIAALASKTIVKVACGTNHTGS